MLMQSFKWLRNPKVFLRVKGFYKVFLGAISQRHTKYDIQHFERPNSNVCFRLTGWWGEKYSHKGGQKKNFSPFFDVVALFILYFYPLTLYITFIWNDLFILKLALAIFWIVWLPESSTGRGAWLNIRA